jgi:hypothetical protein
MIMVALSIDTVEYRPKSILDRVQLAVSWTAFGSFADFHRL